MDKPLGTLGRYRLIRKLAQGGMAEVFLAKSYGAHGFEKPVAIKKILARFAQDEQFVTMLIDEARITSLLTHPNIVPVIDFSADAESCYLVMEYVPGRSFSNLLRALDMAERSLATEHLIHIVKETAAGLHHAHVKTDRTGKPLHIVHRDVSPQNVLLSFEGFVKVIDFGIARARHRLARTEAGTLKGKVRYLAPEQVDGEDVDGRADQFALGIVLWEALARRALFDGDSDLEVMDQVLEAKVPDPREYHRGIPEELARACLRALARRREDRYPSCEALSADLRGILARLNPDYDPSALGGLLRTTFADEIEEDAREEAEAEQAMLEDVASTDPEAVPLDAAKTLSDGKPLPRTRPSAPEREGQPTRALQRRERGEKGRRASEARQLAHAPVEDVAPVHLRDPTLTGLEEESDTIIAGLAPEPAPPTDADATAEEPLPPPPAPAPVEDRRSLMVLAVASAVGGALIAVIVGTVVADHLDAAKQKPAPAVSVVSAPVERTQLKLSVSPPDARVLVDEVAAELRDGVIVVPPGEHRLRVEADGHQAEERIVKVERGQTLDVEVALKAAEPVESRLKITGRSSGLILEVDGKRLDARAPATITLQAGTHEITVRHPRSGRTRRYTVIVDGQELRPLRADL